MIILNIIALCWWEMMMKSKNGLHIQPQVGTGKEVIVLQALNHFRLPDAEYLLVVKPTLNNVIIKFGQFPSI